LVGAIKAQAQKLSKPDGLQVTIQADELPALSAAVEVAAYRIAHEALTNVVRHARATKCHVALQRVESQLQIKVTDNGIGIDLSQELGVGVRSMRERAEELGGEFALLAQAQGGALLYAQLPLHHADSVILKED
jgi:signal transduction histidine kinase